MPKFDEFTGKFSLSKTLRFELKPIGKTWDNLERDGYLQDDKKRARNYELVKMMLDDNHREFIDKVLSTSKLDWNPLANGIILRKTNADDSSKKELEKLQKKYQKDISTMFSKHADFKDLLAKPALDIVKKRLENMGDLESLQSLSSFDKFSVYFSGYHEARENIYQPELKSVSIPWRIVMDNFPRFMENIKIYDKIKSEYPEIIDQLKSNLEIDDLDGYFSVDNYNNYLTQNGIEEYNYIIEGKSTETEIVQGMNVLLNLKHQKDEGFKRILMQPLFKQILSITRRKSFVPKKFENETELLSTIVKFIEEIDAAGILSTLQKLISNITGYNTDKIYIEQSNIPTLSLYIFNSWDALGGKLQSYRANQIGDPMMVKNRRPIDKWLKSPEFQLSTILDAISYSNEDFTQLIDKIDSICNNISEYPSKYSALKSVKIDNVNEEIREKSITTIRETLEPYLDLLHIAKIFSSSEELERDQTFYCDLTECVDSLKRVVQIYNQARTYCTRKSYDSSKIKVKLSLPTLADGWDLDKEKDNRALILRKDDRYFLAIMPPKSKIEFSQIQNESTSFYEKMEYKQVPGPNKMLPKIFVKAKSSKSEFGLTDEILSKYDAGMHKKGDQFDLKFCHELIDYYKSCISQYKKWDVFNFKFKDTAEYNDISEFYSDITEQAYRIDFRKIKSEDIYRYVDEGKLFLFQIYNKDFSEKSHGNKNLHTIYWNSLFSEQNLASPRIKLNGQAELFFRQRSIKEESTIVHKIGTNLVNRLDKDGKTIPPEIYKELNRFYSGNIDALSDSARKYVDKAIVTKSKYDIVKDRRFTVDKMLFHVPITFNHKSKSMAAGLNNEIIEKIIEDKEIKIIGIDRGERNLLYISMIDRNGNIICQNSLNIIDGYDYHSALDVREHGNKESRRNWTKVEGIKQLKEGYLSKVVSILSKMAIENDAIIVMEDLNYGFKKGRFKIEKQVYQAFENMMINKLNYLVFKNRNDEESGSALNGYQLTMPMTDVTKVGKQSGIIFYIPAAFTSKIDPTTGFANLFNFGSITTIEGKRSFFSKMDSIVYDNVTDSFVFEFDYRNFNTRAEDYRNNWSVYTIGHRYKFDKIHKKWVKIDPTQMIKSSLSNEGISFNGELKDLICTGTGKLINEVFDAFKQIMNIRVQNLEEDYIQSPVMNQEGAFYDSRFCQNNLPMGSDANGAYNIALKGELLLRMIESEKDGRYKIPIMTNTSWLTFIQSGKVTWKN